jgi:hypothetical protein
MNGIGSREIVGDLIIGSLATRTNELEKVREKITGTIL